MGTRGFGHAVRTRRLALGITQQELARRLGPGVRIADVARLEAVGNVEDIERLVLQVRRQLQEAASAMWVLDILLDERDGERDS